MLKQITKNEDVVVMDNKVSLDGPRKIKLEEYIVAEYEEIKKLRWEAMMLVTKANEYAIKAKRANRSRFKDLTFEQQWRVKEQFYKEWLEDIDDDKADKMVQLLTIMVDKHMTN